MREPCIRSWRSGHCSPRYREDEVGGTVEKDKALDTAVAQIERQFGKGAIMRMGDDAVAVRVPAISTGSLGLDVALGVGGVPRGRAVPYTHLTLPPNREV